MSDTEETSGECSKDPARKTSETLRAASETLGGESGQPVKLTDLFPNGINFTVQGDKVTVESTPEYEEYLKRETQKEFQRQFVNGEEPSEGMPDVRLKFPRYEDTHQ